MNRLVLRKLDIMVQRPWKRIRGCLTFGLTLMCSTTGSLFKQIRSSNSLKARRNVARSRLRNIVAHRPIGKKRPLIMLIGRKKIKR